MRRKVYGKMAGHCAYCGCDLAFPDMQVDHLYPVALGGRNDYSNLLPSCRSCNHYKHTLTLEKFREAVERFLVVLDRDSTTYRNAVRYGQVIPNPQPVVFYFEKVASGDIFIDNVL